MVSKQKFIIDYNPRTSEIIEKIKCSSSGEIASAVKLSKKAFKTWKEIPIKEKAVRFRKILKDFKKEKKEIADLISLETGKSFLFALDEVEAAISLVDKYSIHSLKLLKNQKVEINNQIIKVIPEPIGVCALITSFVNPVKTPILFLAPSILSGNTVVFKPSEFTPICGKRIYEILNRYLPKGVISIIQGVEEASGLLLNSDIDYIGFNGRFETCKKLKSIASERIINIVYKLNKKDVTVILKDANLLEAARSVVENCFRFSVNQCIEFDLIYIDINISAKFEKIISKELQKYRFENVPLISEEKRNLIINQIGEANRKGMKIILGGKKVNSKGFFIEPTILTNVLNKYQINSSSYIGPLISIQKIANFEEVIDKINNSNSINSVSIWTKKSNHALRIFEKLEIQKIIINEPFSSVIKTINTRSFYNKISSNSDLEWYEKFLMSKTVIHSII